MSYEANDVTAGDGTEGWETVMREDEGTKEDDIG